MNQTKALLDLIAYDLAALRANALDLEAGLKRIARKTVPHDLGPLMELVAQINCAGLAPIEEFVHAHGVELPEVEASPIRGVLSEAHLRASSHDNDVIGVASAISIMRRAARYMEIYCGSTAQAARRLGLKELEKSLREWAREWIGLEVNLNAAAALSIADLGMSALEPIQRKLSAERVAAA
jgi:predicted GIY-YIG superfamily endonuclease